jgi:hypothetical protein
MNLHRISKDLISDHDASSEDYRPKDGQTYLEFKNFTAREHRAWRLPMVPMQTPWPTRRNSILGKGTRPAGGHTVPQQERSIRPRQETVRLGRRGCPTAGPLGVTKTLVFLPQLITSVERT